MKRFREFLTLALSLLLLLSLTACGGSSETPEEPEEAGAGISDYVGLWEYVDENLWLMIYEDETWESLSDQEAVIEWGTVLVDETGITLCLDGTDDMLTLTPTENGDLIVGENEGVLIPVDSIQPQPYFTRNGLEINAEMDAGTYSLENGICSYAKNSPDATYTLGDCYWEVVKNDDQTHDGIREIQFDTVCYVPESSVGTFNGEYSFGVMSSLYDYYTGMWLTDSAIHGNSSRGDNYYVYTIDWNGQSQTIEYAYSVDWTKNDGGWKYIMTKSYVVYLPEDYDGLVFAAHPEADNYEGHAKYQELDSLYPDACILDIDLLDPYSSLYFSICY